MAEIDESGEGKPLTSYYPIPIGNLSKKADFLGRETTEKMSLKQQVSIHCTLALSLAEIHTASKTSMERTSKAKSGNTGQGMDTMYQEILVRSMRASQPPFDDEFTSCPVYRQSI